MSEARYEATPEQYEVWLAVQREPESGRFNIPVDLEFTPGVEVAALRGALQDLAARHPLLRSAFTTDQTGLVRVEYGSAPVPLTVRRLADPYDAKAAAKAAEAISARPFDIARAPLVRGELLQHPDGALLVLCVHHLVCDGWSQQVLVEDLIAAYRARVEGADPASGEQHRAPTAAGTWTESTAPPAAREPDEDAAAYWSALLEGELPSLAPVVDFNRASSAPGRPAWAQADLDERVLAGVRELARAETASPAVVLSACWLALLHAWGAAEAGTSGMLFAARHGDERSVDLQARVLPVVSRVSSATVFRDLVGAVRDQMWDSLDHSGASSEQLRALRRAAGHRSLIDPCVFMHFPAAQGEWEVAGARVRLVEHDSPGAKYDFSLAVLESERWARVRVDFDAEVYRETTAQVFLRQYTALVAAAVADPQAQCGALVSGSDRFTPVSLVDDALPVERTPVHRLVLAQARRRPDAVALRHGGQSLTYGELADRAEVLAQWMRTQGVRTGDLVALLLPRGVTTVVLWLASMVAGAGYLPLDPVYPDAQLQAVLDDASPRLVIGAADLLGRVRPTSGRVLTVEDVLSGALGTTAGEVVDVAPDGVFNVLYTSGSTGRPKGVVLSHEGFTRLLARPDFLDLDETDVVAHLCPLNFDGATYEVWGALVAGAEVVVVEKELVLSPEDLRTVFLRHGVTTMLASTPLMNRLIEDVPDVFQSLRRVFCGGEMISVPHMRKVLRWAAPGTVLHGYGPTENSFTSTWWPVTGVGDSDRTVPIGAPVPGTRAVVVMDPVGMRAAPRGVPGELWLGGAGLARGYLGDPAATARRYVPDGFSGLPGERLYRTGDRVRWTPEGVLEFIGRDDNQVKIRSQRVELGEVTSALSAHPQVQAAVVTVVRNRRGEKELAGFAVLEPGGQLEQVRAHLRAVLPSFAVPRYLVVLEEMPLTPNGKVDRRRLPDPVATSADTVATVPAAAPAQPAPAAPTPSVAGGTHSVVDAVRAAWVSLVEHDGFGLDDNFFDVGGHSLLLVALSQALQRHVGTGLAVADLLRHTTVRAQAALLASARPTAAPLPEPQTPPPAPAAPAAPVVAPAAVTAPAAPPAPAPLSGAAGGVRILPLSARTARALGLIRSELAGHLERTPGLTLADVATTLDMGRERFAHRCAVVAREMSWAAAALRDGGGTGGAVTVDGVVDPRTTTRVVWGFGGLDAGPDAHTLARACAAAPLVRERARAAGLGEEPGPVGPVELFVAQLGLAEELAGRGVAPDAVTGAGAGLVAALVAVGALDFAQGLTLAGALASPQGGRDGVAALLERLAPEDRWRSLLGSGGSGDGGSGDGGLAELAGALLAVADQAVVTVREPGSGRTVVVDPGIGVPVAVDADGSAQVSVVRLLGGADTGAGTGADARTQVLAAVARLWCQGVEADLAAGTAGRRVRLPGYRFERTG